MVLDSINKANDIKNVPVEELPLLASEIREFLIEHISHTGGHLASNLGTVELTMAMHLSFDLPDSTQVTAPHQSQRDLDMSRQGICRVGIIMLCPL